MQLTHNLQYYNFYNDLKCTEDTDNSVPDEIDPNRDDDDDDDDDDDNDDDDDEKENGSDGRSDDENI